MRRCGRWRAWDPSPRFEVLTPAGVERLVSYRLAARGESDAGYPFLFRDGRLAKIYDPSVRSSVTFKRPATGPVGEEKVSPVESIGRAVAAAAEAEDLSPAALRASVARHKMSELERTFRGPAIALLVVGAPIEVFFLPFAIARDLTRESAQHHYSALRVHVGDPPERADEIYGKPLEVRTLSNAQEARRYGMEDRKRKAELYVSDVVVWTDGSRITAVLGGG